MPIFEFVCEKCGSRFEEILAASAPNPLCPDCGGPARRQVSLAAPLKKGAFPYKPGPVHPLAARMQGGGGCHTCNGSGCS